MTPERWRLVERLYFEALAADATGRAAWLDMTCAGDDALRREVMTLLEQEDDPQHFLSEPALDVAARAAAEDVPDVRCGSQIGAYRILSALGAGGMGDVYRARDTQLGRDVAIKILPALFLADEGRRSRFEREARLLAALNHPHIGAIYGVEEHDGVRALVLELVEGVTLEALIAGSGRASRDSTSRDGGTTLRREVAVATPIAISQALELARQIADALDAAHERGIIHRDLKPANVVVTPDGTVKVIDFGLAKASGEGPEPNLLPTITSSPTGVGVVLGTAAYMSPEQARGKPVDKRGDIWAFGCVLYEMLTGRRPFAGETASDTIAAILERDPDWSALPAETPATIRRLLHHCLRKDARLRLHDIADARIETEDAIDPTLVAQAQAESDSVAASAGASPVVARRTRRERTIWVGAAIALAAATGAVAWRVKPSSADHGVVTRFEYPLPEGQTFARTGRRGVAVSPDGTKFVYTANQHLYLRAMDQVQSRPIRGTDEDPMEPVFSPDGTWIAYFTGGRTLKKIAITGGGPVTLAEVPALPDGASWRNGTIVFAMTAGAASGIHAIPDGGGALTRLVSVDPNLERVSEPQMLDDGTHVLFTVAKPNNRVAGESAVVVQSLESGQRTVLVSGGASAHVLAGNRLVYFREGSILGVAFNSRTLVSTGAPVPLVDNVSGTGSGVGQFAMSSDGTLVYQSAAAPSMRALVWVDRDGHEQPISAAPGSYVDPRISPDGTQVAVSLGADIWIWTFAKAAFTRLTFSKALEYNPVWMPAGKQVLFDSTGSGLSQILRKAADGTGTTDVVIPAPAGYPETVSPDGKFLIYHTRSQVPSAMLSSFDPHGAASPLVGTKAQTFNAEISPDGHWVAYQSWSDESRGFEVYVQPFPAMDGGQWQVSSNGGSFPLWARDTRQLFFISGAGMLMSVSVPVQPASSFTHGTPLPLFAARQYYTDTARGYDVSHDGTRFLFVKEIAGVSRPYLTVIADWFDEVRARTGSK